MKKLLNLPHVAQTSVYKFKQVMYNNGTIPGSNEGIGVKINTRKMC